MGDEIKEPVKTKIETKEKADFSGLILVLGILGALALGAVGNVIAGAAAMSLQYKIEGFLLGVAPGAVMSLLLLLLRPRASAFGMGWCIGVCVIALVGGICGAGMVGTSFR